MTIGGNRPVNFLTMRNDNNTTMIEQFQDEYRTRNSYVQFVKLVALEAIVLVLRRQVRELKCENRRLKEAAGGVREWV